METISKEKIDVILNVAKGLLLMMINPKFPEDDENEIANKVVDEIFNIIDGLSDYLTPEGISLLAGQKCEQAKDNEKLTN